MKLGKNTYFVSKIPAIIFCIFIFQTHLFSQKTQMSQYAFFIHGGPYYPEVQGDISFIRTYNKGFTVGGGIINYPSKSKLSIGIRGDLQLLNARIAPVDCDCAFNELISSTSSLSVLLNYTVIDKNKFSIAMGFGVEVYHDFFISSNSVYFIRSDPAATKKFEIFISYPGSFYASVSANASFIYQLDKKLYLFTNLRLSNQVSNKWYPRISVNYSNPKNGFAYNKFVYYSGNNLYATFGISYLFKVLWDI